MVDDRTAEAIQQMKQQGFEPCVVVETSPGNLQAWLNHGKVLPKDESTLPGFTNGNEKYQQKDERHPFVRLISNGPRCPGDGRRRARLTGRGRFDGHRRH
ncbi:MAG: hypothetical protein KIT83_05850 [Bryobacterales bacterium]|nr:hypothetical protein [Bryobacterales bacterium]